MTTAQQPTKPQTLRHFENGARVSHSKNGLGTVKVNADGATIVKFDNGEWGMASTRVTAA